MLKALGQIESGGMDWAIGKDGERSRYQIKSIVWNSYTALPFKHYAKDRAIASKVASQHLIWLGELFYEANHRYPNHSELYVLWNMGVGGFAKHKFDFTRLPGGIKDRAQRYTNLVILYSSKN
jgi:hypothetical protein